jgi:putative CocE/NonD family hydrolase
MASAYPGVDFPMRRNIFPTFVAQWLAATRGRALQARIVHDRAFWSDVFRTWFESGKPFRQLANLFGSECAVLQEWLSHPEPDAYWDAHNPSPEQCGRMQIPILTITGIYDDDQPGALEHYRQHMLHASPSARAQHYLIIGPWDHAGSAGTPRAEFGGLKVGDAALIDFLQLHHEWYAWTMQGGPKPRFLEKAVAYYVTGSERWRYADSLEAITASHQTYFLDSSGAANDVFASGSLGTARATGLPDHYLYDPRDSGAPEIRVEADADESSLIDQATTLALSGRQLVYHSAPFEEDTEVGGFFRLCAWIAIDCPDTDFHVSVHEIDPRGASLRLSTTALRARYREGVRTPKRIDTAAPLRYDFEGFTFVARTVRRSHRLRLIIAPIGRPIETKFAQKNYNAGGVVADESAVDGRAVRVALYHDAEHPSALYVPLTSSHTAARSHRSSVV